MTQSVVARLGQPKLHWHEYYRWILGLLWHALLIHARLTDFASLFDSEKEHLKGARTQVLADRADVHESIGR